MSEVGGWRVRLLVRVDFISTWSNTGGAFGTLEIYIASGGNKGGGVQLGAVSGHTTVPGIID